MRMEISSRCVSRNATSHPPSQHLPNSTHPQALIDAALASSTGGAAGGGGGGGKRGRPSKLPAQPKKKEEKEKPKRSVGEKKNCD